MTAHLTFVISFYVTNCVLSVFNNENDNDDDDDDVHNSDHLFRFADRVF